MKTHEPAGVWPVPVPFRAIYTHASEITGIERRLLISGMPGTGVDGHLPEDFTAQCEQAMNNVEAVLASVAMSPRALAKVTYFLTRTQDIAALAPMRPQRWATPTPPAVTTIVVAALAEPQHLIEIEALAIA